MTNVTIQIPGGGFGIFDGCSSEWGATSAVWGAQYGGSSTNTCSSFPAALKPGCSWRWDWFGGSDNPTYVCKTQYLKQYVADEYLQCRLGNGLLPV